MQMYFPGSAMSNAGKDPKKIGIVTTASLPWLTGASIMPLMHAVYLRQRGFATTLYIPWLPPRQQRLCFDAPPLPTPQAQQAYIRDWLPEPLRPFLPDIRFFPGWYSTWLRSIATCRDLAAIVRPADTVLVEGPEHLFFCHPLSRFKRRHPHVVGIVLTNYAFFHSQVIPLPMVRLVQRYFRFLAARMCHTVISIATPDRADICFHADCPVVPVNAVMADFFRPPPRSRRPMCYFMGKLLAEKGLPEMFAGLKGAGIKRIDLFGSGDRAQVLAAAAPCGVEPVFKGISPRPWEELADYRIFVNCSRSEYCCTTTANALAMQQWVIVPKHPSNRHYEQFPNCLTYTSAAELVERLRYALSHEPRYDPGIGELSWDRAIDRLLEVMANTPAREV